MESVKAMGQERSGHSSVLMNNSIYVAGGKKNKAFLDSVERFDLGEGQWYSCKAMTEKRSQFALVSVAGHLYAIGGRNKEVRSTAEKYDPVADEWTAIPSMSVPRVAATVSVLSESIYIIGGSTTSAKYSQTPTVEYFDTRNEKWSMAGELGEPRDFILAAAIDCNRILAVGGFNSQSKCCKIVEMYNLSQDKWSRVDDMVTNCAGGLLFIL